MNGAIGMSNHEAINKDALKEPAARERKSVRNGVRIPEDRAWPAVGIYAVQLGLIALVLGLWEVGVRLGFIDAFFWSSPNQILATGKTYLSTGAAYFDTWFTVQSTLIGFVLGTVGGAMIGLALWWSRNLALVVEPYLVLFNAVPKIALAPLLILVFGIGLASKVALAVALTIVVSAMAAYAGVKAVDPDLIRMMYSLGASRWQVFTRVVIPSTLPWIASSLRINIGLALSGSIVGEFISSRYGLGKTILYAGTTYEMALVWVGIGILSLVAMIMFKIVEFLEKILLKSMHAS